MNLRYLFWTIVGFGLFIGFIYLLIKRFNISYCIYEMNRGNTDFALLSICSEPLKDAEKDKEIAYDNGIRNKRVKIRHGGWFSSKASLPYFVTRDNMLCVLVVRNKETGNFLVVDQCLNRFKMSKKERKQLAESLTNYVSL